MSLETALLWLFERRLREPEMIYHSLRNLKREILNCLRKRRIFLSKTVMMRIILREDMFVIFVKTKDISEMKNVNA